MLVLQFPKIIGNKKCPFSLFVIAHIVSWLGGGNLDLDAGDTLVVHELVQELETRNLILESQELEDFKERPIRLN